MPTLDEILEQLDDETADAIRAATGGEGPKGLRDHAKRTKEQNDALEAQVASYRSALFGTQLKELGVTVSPNVLNLPADLSPTEPDKVREWAETSGLIAPAPSKPDAPDAELAAIGNIGAAMNGESTAGSAPADINKLAAMNKQEFYATMQAAGRLVPGAEPPKL